MTFSIASPRCDGRIRAQNRSSVPWDARCSQRLHCEAGVLCTGKVSSHLHWKLKHLRVHLPKRCEVLALVLVFLFFLFFSCLEIWGQRLLECILILFRIKMCMLAAQEFTFDFKLTRVDSMWFCIWPLNWVSSPCARKYCWSLWECYLLFPS